MDDAGTLGFSWTAMPLLAEFRGWPGFLGTRGSFMLDVVFAAMFLVVPAMFWSIQQARRGRYELHRWVQTSLGIVLGVAVLAFEVDMRIHGWQDRAEPSAFWRAGAWNDAIDYSLVVHLAFAIPNTLLWAVTLVQAWRHFPRPAVPNAYSRRHRVWAWLTVVFMTMTALTGWVFYYLAFVA